jgi:hypothetical protein
MVEAHLKTSCPGVILVCVILEFGFVPLRLSFRRFYCIKCIIAEGWETWNVTWVTL